MENQVNIDNQNTQQIGQNLIDKSSPAPEKSKINYLAMAGVILVCFVVFGFGGYFLGKQSLVSQNYVNDRQNQVSSPSPTPDPTANWKTYTDTQFNFLIKYPQSWETAQDPNSAPIAVNSLVSGNFKLVLLDKTQPLYCGPYECFPSVQFTKPISDNRKIRLSLNDWVVEFIKSKMPDAKIDPNIDLVSLVVDGQPAVKFDNSVFVSKDNSVYIINFDFSGASGGRARVPEQATFDQILSTFKFTN